VSRNAFPSLIYLFPVVACVFARQGRAQQAAEYYALALHYAFVARSRWFADVVGEPVTAAAASLSKEARAAVQTRVQAQDLWTAFRYALEKLPDDLRRAAMSGWLIDQELGPSTPRASSLT
jgi:hypothetical protein